MKNPFLLIAILLTSLLSLPVFSQTGDDTGTLGLPGDNLDLYAVLDLFQKSKTIEDFEKSLNLENSKINNLDLDNDKKVDFIKVTTKKDGDDFSFVLQDAVSKTETQDVAVILVSKDKNKKVTMQIVGDEELYGKNYIVEPKATGTGVTANPGYTGENPVTVDIPASTTTVVVQSAPIVQYVYSPAYVPYYPPYYYGYYPPYFAAFTVMAVGIYRHNNYYYHGGGYGYGNTTVIHNTNNYNNYNKTRNTSNTVANNKAKGNYTNVGSRPSNTSGNRPSTGAGGANKPSAGNLNSPSTRPSTSTRPTSPSASTRPSTSGSTRPTSPSTTASNRSSSGSSSYSRPSSSSYGGGRSGGGYSGGGRSGGGMRGGGGRR
ncbi:hypothetical protein [Flavobacterium limnophilum]|uniref:hypothetical protein n=1 Tax=Flavobacterium limnophilum TaxID=3003262 RepID=UPI0022AC27D6|nr:hypothetical protein [Flavobacterium limnophilum]